ncbi:glycosyltransferase family 2 protein [Tenacibaculum sp. nBUS_03]|uniref:glycosyltransferase family 2 protein n=1 Tax=Tenacibaculum sp. nBUS_03 TaxID=3395320 RepID=UPI003EBC9BE9
MNIIESIFYVSLLIIFYTYVGYGIILYTLVSVKKIIIPAKIDDNIDFLPEVTIVIPAYNEKDYIVSKMTNTMNLNYPQDKLKIYWVTDGSDDGSEKILQKYSSIKVFHQPERRGKINAMNRVMPFVNTGITIFTDANAMLNFDSIRIITSKFKDTKIGCVSGEKRIKSKKTDKASGSGEGFYWRYESFLKKLDGELYSVVGAAGELFAIRTELYEYVESNIILDDFIISLRIAMKGYKIAYDNNAYATENASATVNDEFKRKVRICTGGIQSVVKLKELLNIFKYKTLSFQFISHRVLRWTLTPILFFLLLPINFFLYNNKPNDTFIHYSLVMLILFYVLIFVGYLFRRKKIKIRFIYIPFYFFIMNLSAIIGIINYVRNKQFAVWEKVNRDC